MSSVIHSMPVLILYPHRRCNCRCLMCDIWKDSKEEEMSYSDLERHLDDIERLRVKWVVFSGGEPLMHSDLFRLCTLLRSQGIRVTILTTGLLLKRNSQFIAQSIDDVIVSLDGPEPIHDQIRRVPGAFRSLAEGVQSLHRLKPDLPISARFTVQRLNYKVLGETARIARQMGCRSISYLAVDLTSKAFNRSEEWVDSAQTPLALSELQIADLELATAELLAEWSASGFVAEDASKFARIVRHFRAHLGLAEPIAPKCNAPWVSAVIESDGRVRPCFFHNPIGTIGSNGLLDVLNNFEALSFRSNLNVAANPICKRCVCSLNWAPGE